MQNTANYVRVSLATIFLFHFVALIAASDEAVTEIAAGDNGVSYRPGKEYRAIPGELKLWSDDDHKAILLSQTEYPIRNEPSDGEDEHRYKVKKAVEPITRKLPIWGEKVRAMGYELPLPFANVYGIFGYINGEAELDVNLPALIVDLPVVGPTPITDPTSINFNIDYNGTTFGGGVTLAGGYKEFFGSLDVNYTHSNIDVVDGEIKTLTVSPRIGVMVDLAAIKGSVAFWVGAMYMDYKQTVTDDINLKEIDSRLPSVDIDFEIDIKNEDHWNYLFGGQWEITKRWQVMAEGGLGNRRHLILGAFFRFYQLTFFKGFVNLLIILG
ncbi:MAG: hypothetical protein WBM69_06420 [Desulfobacterales bacterium]